MPCPGGLKVFVVKRFDIITEADARLLEPGSIVELAPRGHVTPLARDTLRARRIEVIAAGAHDPALPADLAPVTPVRRIAIGSGHAGLALRRDLVPWLRGHGLAVAESGADGSGPVDYPDVAAAVARTVARGEADAGIVIDGAGIGSAIAANKVRGVRAAMCPDETIARYSREHNGANVMTLGATLLTPAQARAIVQTWIGTPMREARYIRRLLKIRRLEEG
jgi:ribose 5-phosphate isomerase B